MALPSPKFYTTGDAEITTHDFGSVEAGAYKPDSTGWKFRLWNDFGGGLSSDDMTSVKISVRDADGGTDELWTQQHWIQIKSSSGSTGVVDDAMTVFQAVGKNKELSLGDIPSDHYRTLYARCYPPTDATEGGVDFQLKVTYQQPQTSICKWITGLRGNGIVASTGDPFAMSTGGSTGTIPYEGGYALINNNEIYYGSSGSYTISATTGTGTYNLYLTESGTFSETTGSVASNELQLYEATYSTGECTALTDKRVYLAGLQAGTTGAMPSTPDLGDIYLDITNGIIYGAKTAGSWTNVGSGTFLNLTDTPANYTGDASKILVVTTGETAVEFTSSTGINHNDFGGLDTGNYQHLTQAEHDEITQWAGAVTLSTGGTVNIPTGQEYQINGTEVKLDEWATPTTGTALNASTGRHGLLPQLSGTATEFLNGSGSFAIPTFLGLSDTPANYTGDASKILTVTTGEDAVEFASSLDNLGPITFSTGGGQITFPATQNASTGANVLDDYEEGVHETTATMSGSGTVTLDTSYDTFFYTKVGRLVTIVGKIGVTSVSSPVGVFQLTLPFTSANVAGNQVGASIGTVSVDFDTGTYCFGFLSFNTASLLVKTGGDNINYGNVIPAGGDEYYFSFSYITS